MLKGFFPDELVAELVPACDFLAVVAEECRRRGIVVIALSEIGGDTRRLSTAILAQILFSKMHRGYSLPTTSSSSRFLLRMLAHLLARTIPYLNQLILLPISISLRNASLS